MLTPSCAVNDKGRLKTCDWHDLIKVHTSYASSAVYWPLLCLATNIVISSVQGVCSRTKKKIGCWQQFSTTPLKIQKELSTGPTARSVLHNDATPRSKHRPPVAARTLVRSHAYAKSYAFRVYQFRRIQRCQKSSSNHGAAMPFYWWQHTL